MGFSNVKPILGIGSALSSFKLLMVQGAISRPQFKAMFLGLVEPFFHGGSLEVQYRCYGRVVTSSIRSSDLEADFASTRELGVQDVYRLERAFNPDLVLDGGGNIGLFTLRAAAMWTSPNHRKAKFVVYEPLPRNVEQIRKHLAANGVEAEIKPCCLGGTRRTIPFYCRAANQSSFDGSEPYDRVMDISVAVLEDALQEHPLAERILIKLDIEGMEIEALEALVPIEDRAIYVVGELHNVPVNRPLLEKICRAGGWTLELFDVDIETASFRVCSPAAASLLDWPQSLPAQ